MATTGAVYKHLMMNPMARKLEKVTERDEQHCATYGGIIGKTFYFLIMTFVGVVLYFVVHNVFPPSTTDPIMVTDYAFSIQEIGIVLGVCLAAILSPILMWAIRPLMAFFGTIYCLTQGFIVAYCCCVSGSEYTYAAWMAAGITVIVVVVMLLLYVKGIVKVTAKFKSIVTTLFIASVLSGIVLFICGLIPPLKPMYTFFTQNMVIGIVGGIVFIIIAALFLLVDFDCVQHTVENKLPKKYEWGAAMAVVFTIIWLYFKILNLILKISSAKNSN